MLKYKIPGEIEPGKIKAFTCPKDGRPLIRLGSEEAALIFFYLPSELNRNGVRIVARFADWKDDAIQEFKDNSLVTDVIKVVKNEHNNNVGIKIIAKPECKMAENILSILKREVSNENSCLRRLSWKGKPSGAGLEDFVADLIKNNGIIYAPPAECFSINEKGNILAENLKNSYSPCFWNSDSNQNPPVQNPPTPTSYTEKIPKI